MSLWSGREADSAESLLEPKNWQKVQDLFAKIIGANIVFLNPAGNDLTRVSRITGFCREIAKPSPSSRESDCSLQVLQQIPSDKKPYFCPHHLYYYGFGIHLRRKNLGHLVIGPVLVGKREDETAYRNLCVAQNIDEENYLDRIREIKVFSHAGISTVLDFLREMTESFLKRSIERKELERLISSPAQGSKSNLTGRFLTTVFANELAHSLMEIASALVGADSGSVLLMNQKEKCFYIKAAMGLRLEALKTKIPIRDGVAGWVARRGKPCLIQQGVKNQWLKDRLKRNEIISSMVLPIAFQNRTLGVVCLNAESKNENFNQENLILLDQLSKLASVAFDRINKS